MLASCKSAFAYRYNLCDPVEAPSESIKVDLVERKLNNTEQRKVEFYDVSVGVKIKGKRTYRCERTRTPTRGRPGEF